MTRKQYFSSGLKDGMPICFGYFAVSFAFGIQAAGIGLSVFEASVLSALNVTSTRHHRIGRVAHRARIHATHHQPAVFSHVVCALAKALAKPAPWAPPRHRLRHDG